MDTISVVIGLISYGSMPLKSMYVVMFEELCWKLGVRVILDGCNLHYFIKYHEVVEGDVDWKSAKVIESLLLRTGESMHSWIGIGQVENVGRLLDGEFKTIENKVYSKENDKLKGLTRRIVCL